MCADYTEPIVGLNAGKYGIIKEDFVFPAVRNYTERKEYGKQNEKNSNYSFLFVCREVKIVLARTISFDLSVFFLSGHSDINVYFNSLSALPE